MRRVPGSRTSDSCAATAVRTSHAKFLRALAHAPAAPPPARDLRVRRSTRRSSPRSRGGARAAARARSQETCARRMCPAPRAKPRDPRSLGHGGATARSTRPLAAHTQAEFDSAWNGAGGDAAWKGLRLGLAWHSDAERGPNSGGTAPCVCVCVCVILPTPRRSLSAIELCQSAAARGPRHWERTAGAAPLALPLALRARAVCSDEERRRTMSPIGSVGAADRMLARPHAAARPQAAFRRHSTLAVVGGSGGGSIQSAGLLARPLCVCVCADARRMRTAGEAHRSILSRVRHTLPTCTQPHPAHRTSAVPGGTLTPTPTIAADRITCSS